jgi:acid phosphatase type 7
MVLLAAGLIGAAACQPERGGCQTNETGRLAAPRTGDLSHGRAPRAYYREPLVDACGAGGLTGVGVQRVGRGPYLQQVGPDGALLVWSSTSEQPGEVLVTAPDGTPVTQAPARLDADAETRTGRQWIAALEGLDPGTIYCYEIRAGDELLAVRTGFRTAPAPGAREPVNLLAFGDVGRRTIDQLEVRRRMVGVPFDLAVIAGDLAYDDGTLEELDRYFFDIYGELMAHMPFYPVLGNHDLRTADGKAYLDAFVLPEGAGTERYYSFDWGQVHFVMLDAELANEAQGAWLERDLAGNLLPWTIVVIHDPPFSAGRHGDTIAVRERFVPIFEAFQVPLVIGGHEHNYERMHPIDGVNYLISGSAGRGRRPIGYSEHTAFTLPVAHFVFITIDRELTGYAVDALGTTFDTFVIAPRAATGKQSRARAPTGEGALGAARAQ